MTKEDNQHNIRIYTNIYSKIIEKAKRKEYDLSRYCEVHHIIPKCCGGNNNKENLIVVPIKVHIILHLLLARIYEDNNLLAFAANAMLNKKEGKGNFSTSTIARFREHYKLALRREGITDKFGNKIFFSKSTVCYNENFKVIRIYSTCWSTLNDGFYQHSVSRAARGKAGKNRPNYYAGYYWKFEEDFKKDHKNELEEYNNNLKLGIIPKLDTSYNNLSLSDKLKLRPKRSYTEDQILEIKERNKGKFFVSPEKYKEGRIKAKETMLKKGLISPRAKIVITPLGEFPTLTKAGEAYGVSRKTISNWISKGMDGFYFK